MMSHQLQQTLQEKFRFERFRPGQLEALTALMTHQRLLCIQPTGHGKSLLYQLPASMQVGITLVISPLLALMRDQLAQLKNRFNIDAASINTDQTDEENDAAKIAARTGKIKILFVAPEQLDHVDRFDFLLNLPVELLVVDEAHCISTWGHDFRPSYRQIIKLVQALAQKNPQIKLLGLTATANQKTEQDIQQQFSVDDKKIVVLRESMDRPNIRLSVLNVKGHAEKLEALMHLLERLPGAGLIYCATRENTEIVAEYLLSQGIKTIAYHAGIDAEIKKTIQESFIHDEYQVIAATNALGMGIDKSNLRYIIHFDFPGSITAYYQEVGRAGRDGQPAEGILLYDAMDSKIQNYFIESAQPLVEDFQQVLQAIAVCEEAPNLTTIKRLTGLHPTRLTVVLAELIEQAFLQKSSQRGAQVYQLTQKKALPDLSRYQQQYLVRNAELAAMQIYAEERKQCLMMNLRTALGDKQVQACGRCNVCAPSAFQWQPDKNLQHRIAAWLDHRTVPIVLSKRIKNILPGVAMLDGKLRSRSFIHFMHERANTEGRLGLTDELLVLLKETLKSLHQEHRLSCLIPLPSRTWLSRDLVAKLLAEYIDIPVLDILSWKEMPPARQGELLNNDQRQYNVAQRMQADFTTKIPPGVIVLFDDYTGSGATLNEAARVLRIHTPQPLIPFTIAAIKWRLGKRGMV